MKRDLPAPPAATYYEQPAIKRSPYKFMVALYTFVSGLSGAAQIIATLADLMRVRRSDTVVRNGRLLAVAGGAVIGPVLLVLDLYTPRRWYNMLRIYRRTSPMSIGTYILSLFGGASVLTAAGHFVQPRAARAAQLPAAAAGAGMSCYTAPLLSATAAPLWASAPRALAAQFATSAFATGAAALSLAERCAGHGETQALDRIAFAATAANAAASVIASRQRARQGVPEPRGHTGAAYKVGLALSTALPLACYALDAVSGPSARRSVLAAAGILAGTLLSRSAFFEAGNESTERAGEYLRFASHER